MEETAGKKTSEKIRSPLKFIYRKKVARASGSIIYNKTNNC